MRALQTATLLVATLGAGLMAGLFAAFAYAVMPGLARSADRTFVQAMQNINRAIVNGWFLLPFLLPIPLLVLATVLAWNGHGRVALPWILAALVLYMAGFFVTSGVNVPLNNALDKADTPETATGPRPPGTPLRAAGSPGTSCAPSSTPRPSVSSPGPSFCTARQARRSGRPEDVLSGVVRPPPDRPARVCCSGIRAQAPQDQVTDGLEVGGDLGAGPLGGVTRVVEAAGGVEDGAGGGGGGGGVEVALADAGFDDGGELGLEVGDVTVDHAAALSDQRHVGGEQFGIVAGLAPLGLEQGGRASGPAAPEPVPPP